MDEKLRVLFVSERNAVRSVVAERVLLTRMRGTVETHSAGVSPGGADPLVVQVLGEIGIGAPSRQPRPLSEFSLLGFDLIVTFGAAARSCCMRDPPTADGALPDGPAATIVGLTAPMLMHWEVPAVGDGPSRRDALAQYRHVRDEIVSRIDTLIQHGHVEALQDRKRRILYWIDRSSLGLTAIDERARFFLFNAQAERLTGLSRTDVLGRECRHAFPPHGLCGSACLFSDRHGCSVLGHEHVVGLRASPSPRTFRVEVSPLMGMGLPARATVAVLYATNGAPSAPRSRVFHGMVGRSTALQEAVAVIRQVARSDYPVLISGESGTGKELAARAIHLESRRSGGPFVPINCGALPEHLLESELFGHVKGAFTGAIRDKKGRFELADGGTLLLDEVGELSPSFQVKLLRVLQEKRFERVGDERSVMVDVRVISSTNRDLRALVREGKFREDLFYRLAVVPLVLPPLRERLEDLTALVDHFLVQLRTDGATVRRVSSAAMEVLMSYRWPGNIRELINALQYASVHCRGEEIMPEHLPFEISGQRTPVAIDSVNDEAPEPIETTPRVRDDFRAGAAGLTSERVAEAIRLAGGNKLKAAKILGIGRATLYRFLERRGVAP